MKTIFKLNNIILNLFCIYFCFGQVFKKVISLKIEMIFMYRKFNFLFRYDFVMEKIY